jgi:hypothetical protein
LQLLFFFPCGHGMVKEESAAAVQIQVAMFQQAAKKAAALRAAKAAELASDDAAKELEGAVKEEGAEANAQLEALKKEQEEKLVKGCSFRHQVWPPLIHTRPW